MVDSTFTQKDLEAIERAIATGKKRVKYENKEVEYRSIQEMLITRDLIIRQLRTEPSSPLGERIQMIFKRNR